MKDKFLPQPLRPSGRLEAMKHRPMLWLAVYVIFSSAAFCQETPPLQVTEWLQAPEGFNAQWSGLRGKIVVLEFWATWCEPCIAAIPHLNQLASEFRDRDVLFLAITDEEANRLKPFLAKQPVNALIGIDMQRQNWNTFGVPSIPHTVLIGKDGATIGATLPENITARVLREALEGKRPVLPPKEGIESDLSWDEHSIGWTDGVVPAMYAIIKPIKTTTSGAWPRPSHITADGVSLEVLVQIAYDIDNYRVDWRMPKDEQVYRAAFRVPEERKDRLLPYMRQTLANLFGIEAHWETRERELFVLRRIEGQISPAKSQSEEPEIQMIRGKISLRRQPVSKLTQLLTASVNTVVIDETAMEGVFDFDLPYQPGQPDVTTSALKDIGLKLLKARRNIQVLVVAPEKLSRQTK